MSSWPAHLLAAFAAALSLGVTAACADPAPAPRIAADCLSLQVPACDVGNAGLQASDDDDLDADLATGTDALMSAVAIIPHACPTQPAGDPRSRPLQPLERPPRQAAVA
jgi:hypothetical protein